MSPTLSPGDHLIVWRPVRGIRRGQVVVYRDRFDDRLRVKRVMRVDADGAIGVKGDNAVLSTSSHDLGRIGPDQVVGVALFRRSHGRGWSGLRYDRWR